MAIKNKALTILYTAWDIENNNGKTGDNDNHTLKIIKDGTACIPTNTPTEVDAVNCPGIYKLLVTADEMNADSVSLCGKSSTTNVFIIPVQLTPEDTASNSNGEEETDDYSGGNVEWIIPTVPSPLPSQI
jgi:hypothetical protein